MSIAEAATARKSPSWIDLDYPQALAWAEALAMFAPHTCSVAGELEPGAETAWVNLIKRDTQGQGEGHLPVIPLPNPKKYLYQKRAVLSGRILELYDYAQPQLRNPTPPARKPATGAGGTQPTPEARLLYRAQSLARARRGLRRLINSNVNLGPARDCFLSLTFRENLTDLGEANRRFRLFAKRLRRYLAAQGCRLAYVAVPEQQKRGAWHYHLALFSFPYTPVATLADLWGEGYVQIKCLDARSDIGAYLAKYLSAPAGSAAGQATAGQKSYWASRGLRRPIVILDSDPAYSELLGSLEAMAAQEPLFQFTFSTISRGSVRYRKHRLDAWEPGLAAALHSALIALNPAVRVLRL